MSRVSRRLGVDFGATSTIIASFKEGDAEAVPIRLSGLSRPRDSSIPALIHYVPDGDVVIGQETIDKGFSDGSGTIRWIRHYLLAENPVRIPGGAGTVSYPEAGRDFLSRVLERTIKEKGHPNEIVFSVPAGPPDSYRDWIASVAAGVGISRFLVIDEQTAAAAGYGFSPAPGDVWAVIDMGGSSFEATIVIAEPIRKGNEIHSRVLGTAAEEVGGQQIDQWLAREVAETADRNTSPDAGLLASCRTAREDLSTQKNAKIVVTGIGEKVVTKEVLFEVLARHEFFERVDSTIQRALEGAAGRGFTIHHISRVFMVGGGSSMPVLQEICRSRFGKEKVFCTRPGDAIARGAACFEPHSAFHDQIQHDYAVRFWNPVSRTHEFRTIIRKGTRYPGAGGVARLAIKASYDGQTQLGLPIFEGIPAGGDNEGGGIELVAGPAGNFRILESRNGNEKNYRWINEDDHVLIPADPPAMKGSVRFEITFNIDGNKRLLVTVRDFLTGAVVWENYPVARLR